MNLINAQELNEINEFGAPTEAEINQINLGDLINLSEGNNNNFWCQIVNIDDNRTNNPFDWIFECKTENGYLLEAYGFNIIDIDLHI